MKRAGPDGILRLQPRGGGDGALEFKKKIAYFLETETEARVVSQSMIIMALSKEMVKFSTGEG